MSEMTTFLMLDRSMVCLCEGYLPCYHQLWLTGIALHLFFFGSWCAPRKEKHSPALDERAWFKQRRSKLQIWHLPFLARELRTWNENVGELWGFISKQGQKHKSKLHGPVWTLFFIKKQCSGLLLDALLWPYVRTKAKQNAFGRCHWSLMSVLSVI